MPESSACVEYLRLAAGLPVGSRESFGHLFYWRRVTGREVNVLGRPVDQAMCFYGVTAGDRQTVPRAYRQGYFYEERMVTREQGHS